MLPIWAVADDLRRGTLATVLPGWAPPASHIYAVYPDNRRMSAKVRLSVDHLARHIGRTLAGIADCDSQRSCWLSYAG